MGPVEPCAGGLTSTDAAIDGQSFEVLVAPHLAVLTAIAARLVGMDEANDVVQEALLRAWRRWCTFDPARGTLRAWLAAIVVDRARRYRRGVARGARLTEVLDPESYESDHAQRVAIEAAVRSLPRRQREVVALFYLADLSVDETARALGLRSGSVKAHLSAARAKLKIAMESR